MATDTARVQLELASGRNEITAPFHQTAQRRRNKQLEPDAVSVDADGQDAQMQQPARAGVAADEPGWAGSSPAAHTIIDVPLAAASPPLPAAAADLEMRHERGRTPWIAFAIALLSVGFAVWWVMVQRMPDIDPRDVIARNLIDARAAMANGRYTDPPERSAFHYFNTVLAVDPGNADAIAGIDAIAERHLTNARVLLSRGRVAEAGVALEKARRVRPDHDGLAGFDAQWRAALRQLLAAATAVAKPNAEMIEQPAVVKPSRAREISKSATPVVESSPVPRVADVAAAAAALASDQPSTSPQAVTLAAGQPSASPQTVALAANRSSMSLQTAAQPVADIEASVVEENTAVSVPEPAPVAIAPTPAAEPKLIKMVQPRYPQEALIRGIEGWVDVSLQVTASGDVIEPRVEGTSRGRLFNKAALTAVEQWKYEPRSDAATSERLRVRLKFQRAN